MNYYFGSTIISELFFFNVNIVVVLTINISFPEEFDILLDDKHAIYG